MDDKSLMFDGGFTALGNDDSREIGFDIADLMDLARLTDEELEAFAELVDLFE